MAAVVQLIFTIIISFMIVVNGRVSPETLKCIEEALVPSPHCTYPSHITSSQAIRQLRDKWIVFMGESTLRQLFLQLLGIIKSESFDRIPDQKQDRKIEERLAGSRFTFHYYEYYDNLTQRLSEDGAPQLPDGRMPDLLILNDGLHDLLYDHKNMLQSWQKLSETIVNFKLKYPQIPMMWIPPSQIHDEYLTKHRKTADWFDNQTVYKKCITKQKELYSTLDSNAYEYYYDTFKNISYNKWNYDGIHSMHRARLEAEGLIRIFYHLNTDPSAAWIHDKLTAGQIMTLLFYSWIFVIVLIAQCCKLQFYGKKAKTIHVHDHEQELVTLLSDSNDEVIVNDGTLAPNSSGIKESDNEQTNNQRRDRERDKRPVVDKKLASDTELVDGKIKEDEYELQLPPLLNIQLMRIWLNNYIKHQTVYMAFFQIAICLILLYLFDGPQHLFISPSLKHYNRDFFIFLHMVFLLVSYLTFTKNTSKDCDKIVSRLQTEEWKGIMQIVFVMYHYFDAAEVYNMIRVFIGAYVWMTGFGNTSFFIKTSVFNINRLFGMLFRLNWLVFWVCLLLNQPLILYYICPLHTFFFLFVYTTWGIGYQYNSYKYVKEIKLIVSGLALCLLFETPIVVFNTFWWPLSFLLEQHGSLHEWRFRTTLDHYATWLGMVFAIYFNDIYHCLTVTLKNRKKSKILICVGCVLLVVIWYEFVYRHDKWTYNKMHPYTEAIPIFSYIILRNVWDEWRPYYSRFLAWMGQITLESYIFQYHLYMINDAKSILTVIDGYPLCNFVLVSCFYVCISRVAFDATNTLRNYLYPPRSKKGNVQVLKETAVYIAILIFMYIVSYIMSLSIE